jgi:hypothetical protein
MTDDTKPPDVEEGPLLTVEQRDQLVIRFDGLPAPTEDDPQYWHLLYERTLQAAEARADAAERIELYWHERHLHLEGNAKQ